MSDKMPDEIIWNSDVDGKPRTKGGCANDTLYRRADLPKEVDFSQLIKNAKHYGDKIQFAYEACLRDLVALGVIKDKGV